MLEPVVAGEGAAEVKADDGAQQMRVERGDREAADFLPVDFFHVVGEEPKAFFNLRVTDLHEDVRAPDGDDLRQGDDGENARECDDAARPLEARVGVASGAVDVTGLLVERLHGEQAFFATGGVGHGPHFHHAAHERGAHEGDEFGWECWIHFFWVLRC